MYRTEELNTFGPGLAETASKLGRSLVNWVVRSHQRRKAVEHLRGLNDAHLRDLGIDRSEILSIVYADTGERRHGFYGYR
jgi:uncharacterized protein YjiS (DUF1127 family)